MTKTKKAFTSVALALLAMAVTRLAVADGEVFKVGTDPDYRPISFADASGELIGFDPDFAKSLSEHLGVKMDYQGVAWDGIIPALQAGKIDAITSMGISDKRKEVISFSQPFLTQAITTVVRSDQPNVNPTAEDLKSLKVGVMVNTAAAGVLEKLGVQPAIYNTVADEYADLLLGRIDTVAIENINGSYTATTMHPGKLRVTNVIISTEKQVIGVAMRKDDQALVDRVNQAIDKMRADGSLDAIATKWFGNTDIIAKP